MITLARLAIGAAAALAATPSFPAYEQAPAKIYQIGFIQTAAPSEMTHLIRAFEEGLEELGYVEGRNIVIERRFADGRQERLPALAEELVRLKVDVIVTGSNPVIAAVKQATTTIPVVMAVSRDPVGSGFVASLARPGGNITGLSSSAMQEAVGKNLELLKEVVPKASRVALLWNPVPPGAGTARKAAEDAARKLGMQVQVVQVRGRDEFEGAFAAMARDRADSLFVLGDPVTFTARDRVISLAARHRLPAVYWQREFVDGGGLMSYGTNLVHQYRRAAVYVDKILKGAKPGDLPVEQASKFETVINLKTAKSLGLVISPSLLMRVDEVVE